MLYAWKRTIMTTTHDDEREIEVKQAHPSNLWYV
jgi:hypothetical protein